MKKILITLFFVFAIGNMAYASHTHSNDCYNRVAHTHNDNCYTISTKKCGEESRLESTTSYKTCEYCGKNLWRVDNYAYVCTKNREHKLNSVSREYVSDGWEKYEYPAIPDEDGAIIIPSADPAYIHNCINENGTKIINVGQINGLPGPFYICETNVESKDLTCTKEYDVNEVICNTVIKSITAKTKYQTSKNPDFTLVLTYKDEHTKEVQPKMTTFTTTATYAKDSKIIAYYQNGNTLEEITFYITTPATPTPTRIVTPTPTKVVTPTPTKVVTPTPTKVVTPTPTKVVTPTPTPTKTITPTPTKETTITPTIIATNTITPTPTITTTITPTMEENAISITPTKEGSNLSTTPTTTIEVENETNKETTNEDVVVENIDKDENKANDKNKGESEVISSNLEENNTMAYVIIGLGIVVTISVIVAVTFAIKNNKKNNNPYW